MVLGACGGTALPPPGARASSPRRAARGASGPPQRMRMSRARLSPPLMPIRPRPIVQGHPPPTGRYFGDHGANYVDAATPASLPTPASPPVSRRDGLMRALACPVLWGGPRPLPEELSATRRDGLALELALLGTRGGPHRTTQPHTICRRPVGGLGWVQLPRAAHLIRSCARQDGLPLLPATSGTPWKAQVRIAAAAGLPGAVALELAAGK